MGVKRAFLTMLAMLCVAIPASPAAPAAPAPAPVESAAPAPGSEPIWVSGARFYDGGHGPVRLRGVNISGAEYACQEGWGIWDTPDGRAPGDATLRRLRAWGANTIRLPVNETCWLGLAQVDAAYRGGRYRRPIEAFVARATRAGFAVVLDLHRTAPGSRRSLEQDPMPNRDHSPAFWRSAATAFKANRRVLFGAFNEPFPYGEYDTARAWRCWWSGCLQASANGGTYQAAGMGELVAAIRSTGARNVILLAGIHWAENLSRWRTSGTARRWGQVAADVHLYSVNECSDTGCYDSTIAPVARRVPVLVGEIGPDLLVDDLDRPCRRSDVGDTGFDRTTFDWIDGHRLSWTAWAYNPWPDCWAIARSWGGEPTRPWGEVVRARLVT
ncbi:glycoside hydrolase family 5 protein [Flindersiella endophytica]